jgi:hypothetical protein
MEQTGAAPGAPGSEGQTLATGEGSPGYLAHVKDNGLKGDSAIGAFLAQKAPDLDSLVRGYHELSTKSANMVEIPGHDAPPEASKAFWARLGVPDAPDKYELPRLEGDYAELHSDEREAWFRGLAHQHNIPAETAKALLQGHNELVVKEFQAVREAEAAAIKESESKLQTDWGKDYESNLTMAQTAMKVLSEGNEEITAALNVITPSGARLGDHPALIKLFYNVSLSLTEASVESGSVGDKEKGTRDASGHLMLEFPSMKET